MAGIEDLKAVRGEMHVCHGLITVRRFLTPFGMTAGREIAAGCGERNTFSGLIDGKEISRCARNDGRMRSGLRAVFFAIGEILVEQVVHGARAAVFQVGFAGNAEAGIEKIFRSDGHAGRDVDLHQIGAAILFRR